MEIQAAMTAVGLSLPAALASGIAATVIFWAGFFRTYWLVIAYLLVFLIFSQHVFPSHVFVPIYNRGTGTLVFSWLCYVLWGLGAMALLRDKLLRVPTLDCSMRPWILGFLLLFLAHSAVGFALGIPAVETLSAFGLVNIANMGLLTLLLLRALDSRKALELLITCALVTIAARDAYGLVRFVFFGGDPANPYDSANQALGSKLTFFDICDSLLACMAAAYCGYRLLHDYDSLGKAQKWFFAVVIALGVATVLFSLRRTAWGGFALVSALMIVLAPKRKRLAIAIPIGALLAAGLAILFLKRLLLFAQPGWSALYYDMVGGAHYGQASLRTLELQLGFEAYLERPIFGQGPWGKFEAYSGFGEMWHGGDAAFGFVHSGVVHILFKSGLVGFALLCGLLLAFVRFVKRAYPQMQPRERAVLVMGAGGALFMVPDFLVGTPLIQLRATQLLGLCFALPYVAYHIARRADKRAA